jgi:hypothetical protein
MAPGEAHVDELTYLDSFRTSGSCEKYWIFPAIGTGYYCIADILNNNIIALICLNIFVYLLTNLLIYENLKVVKAGSKIILLLLILDPYRAHLALHVLKDTLIIFSTVFIVTRNKQLVGNIFGLSAALIFRPAFLLYLLAIKNKLKIDFIIALVIIISASAYLFPGFNDRLLEGGVEDMTFQTYDKVPNFNEYGILGDVARSILWPPLVFSGLFIVLSPAILFFPILFGIFTVNFWLIKTKKRIPISILFSIALFAFITPGFTSFIRYIYPILTIIPILVSKSEN